MIGEPKLEHRDEQPYVGIRTRVPIRGMKKAIPESLARVSAWLEEQGAAPAGAPFVRFHVINMQGDMDIEMGVPVADALHSSDSIQAGVLPAGQYAVLVYTGVRNGIKANAALLDWGAKNGLVWDRRDVETGDAFRSRYESYLTDPIDEPKQAKWEIEVAILTKE